MTTEDLITEFLNQRRYAVVGVSADHNKYGYKVWRDLQENGYITYAVNPKYEEIEGQRCYESLDQLPDKVDVVDVVVPPEVGETIVRQCAELGLTRVWLQPGAESEDAIRFCREHGIKVLHDVCVMAQRRVRRQGA